MRFACIVAYILFFCAFSTKAETKSLHKLKEKDLHNTLKKHHQEVNNGLSFLLKINKELESSNIAVEENQLYLIRSDTCKVFSSINPNIIYDQILLIEEKRFSKVEELGNYMKLKSNHFEFWILKECAVVSNESPIQNVLSTYLGQSDKFKTAQNIGQIVEENYNDYLEFLSENKHTLFDENGVAFPHFKILIDKIENKKFIFDQVYKKMFSSLNTNSIKPVIILDRLSISAQLSFGSSKFSSKNYNQAENVNKGGNTNIGINARYLIDEKSRVNFHINNITETRITSYSVWKTGAEYSTRLGQNLLKTGVNYQSYNEKSSDINDNNRTQLFAGISKVSKEEISYRLRYQYTSQNYTQLEQSSFNRHLITSNATIQTGRNSDIMGEVNLSNNSSQNAFSNFNFINPRISFNHRKANFNSRVILSVENTSYSENDALNNQRYLVNYKSQALNSTTKDKTMDLGAIYRRYPGGSIADYIDGFIQLGGSMYGDQALRNSTIFRARYFPDQVESSYADFRVSTDRGRTSFLRFDNNLRALYPKDDQLIGKLDGYIKAGWSIYNIRIGPVFRWHIVYDFKAENSAFFKYDKNNVLYGLEASGQLNPFKSLRLNFRASYDISTVYNFNYTDTEEDLISRNPSNFQIDMDISYLLDRGIEFFGRVNTFRYQSDYLNFEDTNLLEENTGRNLQFGMRLRNK